MKKRFLFLILFLLCGCLTANASDKIHVQALENFSADNPSDRIDVKVIQDSYLDVHELKAGDIIHCEVTKITNPKRGKISATFYVIPVSYTSCGETKMLEEGITGKYSKTIISKEEIKKNVKPAKVAKKAAVTAGGFFIKGLSPAVSMAEGMIKNEDGNRLKSGVHQVYEDSPVAYVEKGEPVDIKSGDEFYFIFKTKNNTDDEDFEYSE